MNINLVKLVESKPVINDLKKSLCYFLQKEDISYSFDKKVKVRGGKYVFQLTIKEFKRKYISLLDEILTNLVKKHHKNFTNLYKVSHGNSIEYVFKYEFTQKDFRKEKLKKLL